MMRPLLVRFALLGCAVHALSAQTLNAQTRIVRIESRILGEIRTLHVSVPANYRLARQRYQVTYLLDGHVKPFFDLAVAASGYSLSGDVRDYAMPAQIIVGIEQKDRSNDLNRGDEKFTRFLVDEVIPYIDREYRTVPFRTLIGHSLGGRFALLTLCRAPTVFPAVIAISPSIADSSTFDTVQRCMRQQFTQTPSRVRQLVLSVGEREARLRPATQRLAAFTRDSAPHNWRVYQVDGAGLGHTETPFTTIPLGMRFVQDRAVWEIALTAADSVVNRLGDPTTILAAALLPVSERVGFPVPPSLKWLEVIARTRFARDGAEAAVKSAQAIVDAFPESLVGYGLLADAYLKRLEPALARKAIADALQMLERLELFDEGAREQQRDALRSSLAALGRH